jgi:ankyrin repeat protein
MSPRPQTSLRNFLQTRLLLTMLQDAIVERLLEAGADFNAQGGKCGNALQAASYGGHNVIVERLFEAGADANALRSCDVVHDDNLL